MIDYWPLLGIALVVIGFALRFNPLLVVAVAAIVTGLLGHMPFLKVLATLGNGFNENRYVTIIWIVLPVIGLLERYGLQQRARALIAGMRGATAGRLLIVYLGFRQILSALGLTSVAGHAQTVRPLVAPMAVAAAEKQHGELDEDDRRAREGDVRRDRQCRPVLRRGHFPRHRVDPAHPGVARELRDPADAVPAVGLGDPDRDLRVPDPRRAAAAARPPARRARR